MPSWLETIRLPTWHCVAVAGRIATSIDDLHRLLASIRGDERLVVSVIRHRRVLEIDVALRLDG
jgi:hypothetical protein